MDIMYVCEVSNFSSQSDHIITVAAYIFLNCIDRVLKPVCTLEML